MDTRRDDLHANRPSRAVVTALTAGAMALSAVAMTPQVAAVDEAGPPAALVDDILGPPTGSDWDAAPVLTAGTGRHRGDEYVWQDFVYDDRERADNAADIVEVRVRPDGDAVRLRVVLNTLRVDDAPVLTGMIAGRALALTLDGATIDGAPLGEPVVDFNDNTIEIAVPGFGDVETAGLNLAAGTAEQVADLAFNAASAENFGKISWHNGAQNAAIDAGDLDAFTVDVDLAGLRAGRTDDDQLEPGMHVQVYRSLQDLGEGYGSSFPKYRAIYMPYTLYVPTGFDPTTPTPLHLILHSLNNTHTEFTLLNVYDHIAEPYGALAITPLAMGMDGWYRDEALVDTLTAWDHVRATLAVDDSRTTVTGYSMGGYGTYRLTTLLPERFAAASLWAGVPSSGPASGNTGPQLENTLHVPFHVVHGAADPLVPYATTSAHVLRFDTLGHTYRLHTHPNYHHWSDRDTNDYSREGAWLNGPVVPARPGHVVFRVRPESWAASGAKQDRILGMLDRLDVEFDSSHWVRDVEVSGEGDVTGVVDLISEGVAARSAVARRITGANVLVPADGSGPGLAPQPYTTTGIDRTWAVAPGTNRLVGTLTGVHALTIDLAHAGLNLDGLELAIEADGPVRLTLVDGGRSEVVDL